MPINQPMSKAGDINKKRATASINQKIQNEAGMKDAVKVKGRGLNIIAGWIAKRTVDYIYN